MGAKATVVRDNLVPVRPVGQLAARVGLWSLVTVGFLGGVVGLLRPSPSVPPATAQDPADAVAGPDVAGFAELAVGAWLEAGAGEAESVSGLFLEDPADLTSSIVPIRVSVHRSSSPSLVGVADARGTAIEEIRQPRGSH